MGKPPWLGKGDRNVLFANTLSDYGLRSLGYGERILPKSDITLCEQFVLIGSGMIWNIYFGVVALFFGFFFATALALGKNAKSPNFKLSVTWLYFYFSGLTAVYTIFLCL